MKSLFKYTTLLVFVLVQVGLPCTGRCADDSRKIPLKVGIPGDFRPQYVVDEQGSVSGFAIDVFEALARKADLTYQYVLYPSWGEAHKALRNGEIDVIPNMGITPGRSQYAEFTIPYETFPVVVFIRAGNPAIEVVNDLRDKVVGVMKTNVGAKLIRNIPHGSVKVVTSRGELLFSLLAGQVDAAIFPEPLLLKDALDAGVEGRLAVLGDPVTEIKRSLAFSRFQKDMIAKFNPIIEDFVATAEYKRLFKKWYGDFEEKSDVLLVMTGAGVAVLLMTLFFGAYRKKLQNAQHVTTSEKNKYESLFSELTVGCALHEIIVDEYGVPVDFRFLSVNEAYQRITGLDHEKIVGKRIYEVLPSFDSSWVERFGNVAITGRADQFEEYSPIFDRYFEIRAYSPKRNQFATLIIDVTERVNAREAIARAERKWKHTLIHIPLIGLSLDPNGRITFVNEHFCKVTGWSEEEVLGKDWFEMFLPEHVRDQVKAVFLQTMLHEQAGEYSSFENEIIDRNGQAHFIAWSNVQTLNPEGMIEDVSSLGVDLTERQLAEQELANAKKEFESIFNNSQVGIMLLRDGRQFHRGNQRLADIMGYDSPEEMQGLSMREFHLDDQRFREFGRKYFFKLRDADQMQVDYQLRRKDGVPIWCSLSGRALNPENLDEGVVWVIENLEPRKALERELVEAAKVAEAASIAKSEFLANMSHEIRTPINGILGMLQLMKSGNLSIEMKEYTTLAIEAAHRLTSLLTDILDLSRVEAGKMELANEPFDLSAVLSQSIDLFKPSAQQAGLALQLDFDPAISPMLMGDPNRLQQVLVNLVGNAIKFTQKGSIVVSAYALSPLRETEQRILFAVQDSGVGIDEEKLRNLFTPFSQLSRGYSRSHQGAGLGLSICKRLVELMKGNISVSSEPGKGSTFYFSLSFRKAERFALGCQDAQSLEHVPVPFKVLVAEDDRISRMAVSRYLEKTGATVVAASDGAQAVELLRQSAQQGDRIDVVLMDVQMPVMDGIAATRAIRNGDAGETYRSIPIIALTAYVMAGDRDRILSAGMDSYLSKPLEVNELKELLLQYLPVCDPSQ